MAGRPSPAEGVRAATLRKPPTHPNVVFPHLTCAYEISAAWGCREGGVAVGGRNAATGRRLGRTVCSRGLPSLSGAGLPVPVVTASLTWLGRSGGPQSGYPQALLKVATPDSTSGLSHVQHEQKRKVCGIARPGGPALQRLESDLRYLSCRRTRPCT